MKRKRNRIGAITLVSEGLFKGDQFYAGFQEFGWKAGTAKTEIEGKHFMERAAQAKGRSAGVVATVAIKADLAATIPKVG